MQDRIDTEKMRSAIDMWEGYKAAQTMRVNAELSGLMIPSTRAREFMERVNMASRMVVNALGCTDVREVKALGELLTNAAHNMELQAKDPRKVW